MDKWLFNEDYNCWSLENIAYTEKAQVPEVQRINIFVPKAYMDENGQINPNGKINGYTAGTAPVIFENNSAGYMQMPNVALGEGRCYARPYLNQGYVYISCGNRGSNSVDKDEKPCGKSPANLIDIKTAIRFVRHNADRFPGNMDRIISVGWSAGGAMSTLVGVTGNNKNFDKFLKENGAYMDESDSVFASQIYCPIVDLGHADLAYEWMFSADETSEDSPAGPAETMTSFKRALSDKLREKYIKYFNSLNLKSVEEHKELKLGLDGRSGSAYEYIMDKFSESATEYLNKLQAGELPEKYSVDDYMSGNYTYMAMKRHPRPVNGPQEHAQRRGPFKPEFEELQGDEKSEWLLWDGKEARISDLDTYVLNHRRRMKGCTSFDILSKESGENSVFGTVKDPYVHFDMLIAEAIEELKEQFSEEYEKYYGSYMAYANDEALKNRMYLIDPHMFIGTDEKSDQAQHYRICVGARDADTATTISMTLACKLADVYNDVTYKIIWDKPHCEADYEGDVIDWIESIIK